MVSVVVSEVGLATLLSTERILRLKNFFSPVKFVLMVFVIRFCNKIAVRRYWRNRTKMDNQLSKCKVVKKSLFCSDK